MMRTTTRAIGTAMMVLLASGGIAACSTNSSSTPPASQGAAASSTPAAGSAGSDLKAKIGLLLPEISNPRYEGKDKPLFEANLKRVCPNCTLLYANASSDESRQVQQAQSMLTQGVKVLVIDPFDGTAAGSIVAAAKAQNVPVVSYDRLIQSPDVSYLVGVNYRTVGEMQGQALVEKLKQDGVKPGDGGILMINGSDTDPNAAIIRDGAMKYIGPSGYKILAHFESWDPSEVQPWASSQVARLGTKIIGVYSANDTNAGAVVAAMKAANFKVPPITGLAASVPELQRIVSDVQFMTVYMPIKTEAKVAAEVAYQLAQGQKPGQNATQNGIPANLVAPIKIVKSNIMSTIIKDGFQTVSDICTPTYAADCAAAGIK